KGRLRRPNNPDPLILFNNPIPWKNEVQYLGVILDNRLRYTSHINNICKKFKNKLLNLQPILKRKSKLSLQNKITIHKVYLQPILSYACAIWGNTINSNIEKIQVQQNRAIRLITGAPTFIPRKILHEETNIESITQIIQKLATHFYSSLEQHDNPTINALSSSTSYTGTRKPPPSSQIINPLF
ncbi:RNA-directed DNA polymerase from mobile element jockey, partial [Nephila pilipes]